MTRTVLIVESMKTISQTNVSLYTLYVYLFIYLCISNMGTIEGLKKLYVIHRKDINLNINIISVKNTIKHINKNG